MFYSDQHCTTYHTMRSLSGSLKNQSDSIGTGISPWRNTQTFPHISTIQCRSHGGLSIYIIGNTFSLSAVLQMNTFGGQLTSVRRKHDTGVLALLPLGTFLGISNPLGPAPRRFCCRLPLARRRGICQPVSHCQPSLNVGNSATIKTSPVRVTTRQEEHRLSIAENQAREPETYLELRIRDRASTHTRVAHSLQPFV